MAKDLKHFGVMGMRWGIRKRVSSPEHSQVKTLLKTKKLHEMTNAELKAFTTRMQLEKQFKDLTKKEVSPGQKFLTDILSSVGKQVISSFVAKYANQGFESAMNQASDFVVKKKATKLLDLKFND